MPSFRLNLLTRLRSQVDKHCACLSSSHDMESIPPPLPPKDTFYFTYNTTLSTRDKPLPQRELNASNPRVASSPPVQLTQSQFSPPSPPIHQYPRRRNRSEPAEFIDAHEEEIQRQARLKRERQIAALQQAAEEEQRKKTLEAELQYAAMIRMQREEEEREIEQAKARELETRKQAEKEKRIAEAKRIQEWQDEQNKRAEYLATMKVESQRRRDEERRNRDLSSSDRGPPGRSTVVSGWVSVQSGDSLTSKRRYCRVDGQQIKLCKDSSISSPVMECIELDNIAKVSDNEDDFYGLESLSHAFGIRTIDGRTFVILPEVSHQSEDFISAAMQLAGL